MHSYFIMMTIFVTSSHAIKMKCTKCNTILCVITFYVPVLCSAVSHQSFLVLNTMLTDTVSCNTCALCIAGHRHRYSASGSITITPLADRKMTAWRL
jgi:hypothetical protein